MRKNSIPSHHGVEYLSEEKYTNKTIQLLYERGSVRNFQNKTIPKEVLDLILTAGIHAPTAGNLQPYSIIKITDKKMKSEFVEMMGQKFIGEAPVNLLFCIDYHRLKRWAELEVAPFTAQYSFRHFWVAFQDTIIAAQNICTAADSVGLGSVYIGSVLEIFQELKNLLKLPDLVFPVVLLCMGYPNVKPKPRKKLGIEVTVHDEVYHDLDDEKLLNYFNKKYQRLNDQHIEATQNRLDTLYDVTLTSHGEEYAKKVKTRVEEIGYINEVQRYFGLHYRASIMPCGNEEFLKTFEDFGFKWFKKWEKDSS